jgi:hypothetical protein
MIAKISNFVKAHFNDIMLFIIIALLVLLSFAIGYITAKYQFKQPIQIEPLSHISIFFKT